MTPETILVVEDNVETQRVLSALLSRSYNLQLAATLAEAEVCLKKQSCDLVLLDVSLPDGDGYSFCARIKNTAQYVDLPVFFLTSSTKTTDKVHGFQLGADDYVAKPFDPEELKARIEARLRKERERRSSVSMLVFGTLKLNLNTQQAYRVSEGREQSLDLSPIEFKLLHYFCRNVGQVLTRMELVESVWGGDIHVLGRTIDAHVSRLRKKIQGCSHTIKTAHSQGYVFQESESKTAGAI